MESGSRISVSDVFDGVETSDVVGMPRFGMSSVSLRVESSQLLVTIDEKTEHIKNITIVGCKNCKEKQIINNRMTNVLKTDRKRNDGEKIKWYCSHAENNSFILLLFG